MMSSRRLRRSFSIQSRKLRPPARLAAPACRLDHVRDPGRRRRSPPRPVIVERQPHRPRPTPGTHSPSPRSPRDCVEPSRGSPRRARGRCARAAAPPARTTARSGLDMRLQPKHARPSGRVMHTHIVEDERPPLHAVRQHVDGRPLPRRTKRAVEPDLPVGSLCTARTLTQQAPRPRGSNGDPIRRSTARGTCPDSSKPLQPAPLPTVKTPTVAGLDSRRPPPKSAQRRIPSRRSSAGRAAHS